MYYYIMRGVIIELIIILHHRFYIISYIIVTYFSVFKLWFTVRALANALAPESSISFLSRLWK